MTLPNQINRIRFGTLLSGSAVDALVRWLVKQEGTKRDFLNLIKMGLEVGEVVERCVGV